MLPAPSSLRFKPLRSGLMNLFKYENQQFWYENGRLLVRGNNGSGKSRVLALQLPFLLDGEISPSRVEPDGDIARSMAWHLLMDEHEQRSGYTWIEFGRKDEQGGDQFLTLGCGMRAVRGGENQPVRWFFVTEKRVDADFVLLRGRQPLSLDQLAEVLGKEALFRTAGPYRAEVDRRLFGLGAERYAALLELLIKLRAPQLAKKLDERSLYAALSDALPPLPQRLIDDVASSFKNLDSLRRELAELEALEKSVTLFQEGYAKYLQCSIMRRAAQLRTKHAAYERSHSELTGLERLLTLTRDDESAAELSLVQAREQSQRADAQWEALRQSPESLNAETLDAAQREAQASGDRLVKAAQEEQKRDALLEDAERARDSQEEGAGREKDLLAKALNHAAGKAPDFAFHKEHLKIVPALAHWEPSLEALVRIQTRLDAELASHRHRLAQLEERFNEKQKSEEELRKAQENEQRAEAEVVKARGAEQTHDGEARLAFVELRERYDEWSRGLVWLRPSPWSDLSEALERWLDTASLDERFLPRELERVMREESAAQAKREEQLCNQRDAVSEEMECLDKEKRDLEQGRQSIPRTPEVYDGAARHGRAGAPFWQVCEFQSFLSPAQRAGLEAALEASGVLDAWLMPDGRLIPQNDADSFLRTLTPEESTGVEGATLDAWLVPDLPGEEVPSHGLSADCIRKALTQIAAGPGGLHWVTLEGYWQMGPLQGLGRKACAEFLGSTSRENSRQRRLRELEQALEELSRQHQKVLEDIRLNDERRQQAIAERQAAPGDDRVLKALTLRTETQAQLFTARTAFAEFEQRTRQKRIQLEVAKVTFETEGTLLGFVDLLDRVPQLRPAFQHYETALERLWSAAKSWVHAERRLSELKADFARKAEDASQAREQADVCRREALQKEEHYRTLQATLGRGIQEYQERVQQARVFRERAQETEKKVDNALHRLRSEKARHEAEQLAKVAELQAALQARESATREMRLPLHHGLFAEAKASFADIENEDWTATRAIEIARRIDRELQGTDADDDAWNRCQNHLQASISDLQRALGAQGHSPQTRVVSESLSVVECPFMGQLLTPAAMRAQVSTERQHRELLLSSGEREIIDNHLIGEVALNLQDLIADVHDRTLQMNKEMTRCTTSLGLSLRLVWVPQSEDMPADLPSFLKLISAQHELWKPEERSLVGEFLHRLIQEERRRDQHGTWVEHLQRALDYRRWHSFGVERHQNGRWERMTRRRYGTGSGGEKALMLTVPQMAAAAAHYSSAARHAPHLILLDEAFAGMDSTLRARCMGLLQSFDLDFVMTSEREWGAHETIDGLAIYQLVADAEAVAATRWVWNGKQRLLAPVADTPPAPPLKKVSDAEPSDELFPR